MRVQKLQIKVEGVKINICIKISMEKIYVFIREIKPR